MTSPTPEVPETSGTGAPGEGTPVGGAPGGGVSYDDVARAGTSRDGADPERCGQLLDRIREGDESAFELLFREYGGVMLAAIVRIVRDRSLGEEVLQECFTEIWKRATAFDSTRGTGRGWIITLCRRRAIDCVRSVQSQRDRDVAQGIGQLGGVGEPAEDTAIARAEALRTATALRDLGEPQASTIALAYYEDMSHAQISEALDVPLGTVKSRIRDGMTKLKTMLEGGR